MVTVVNVGALAVIGLNLLVAMVAWRLRSPIAAIKWTAVAAGAAWVLALLTEWIISFSLGAS